MLNAKTPTIDAAKDTHSANYTPPGLATPLAPLHSLVLSNLFGEALASANSLKKYHKDH